MENIWSLFKTILVSSLGHFEDMRSHCWRARARIHSVALTLSQLQTDRNFSERNHLPQCGLQIRVGGKMDSVSCAWVFITKIQLLTLQELL